jgi:hypothetical protein
MVSTSVSLAPFQCFLENAPTSLNGIVLTVVGRIVEQMNRLTNLVCKRHHPLEELSPSAAAFRTIINFELNALRLLLLLRGEVCPPFLEGIDNKVTGLIGTTKDQV